MRPCATGESFSADTSVATSSSATAISDLKPGDQVMAYDPRTGETAPHTVTAVMVHTDPATENLVTDKGSIETTPNHPFFTTDRGWVQAGSLKVGEKVRTESGGSATVVSFTVDQHPASMWDLTVDTAHSFFVGSGAVLVHNCINVSELQPTQTVLNNLASRPYINSPSTIQDIVDGGTPIPDPGGVPGALRWDVPGFYNGSDGTWQLVIDPATNRILHFLFVRS